MNSRRGFLGRLAAVATLGAVPIAAIAKTPEVMTPDTLKLRGWTLHWRDYRAVYNQMVEVGFWWGYYGDIQNFRSKDLTWVSTTLGVCEQYHELDEIDMSLVGDGIVINEACKPLHRELAKKRALDRLLRKLDM